MPVSLELHTDLDAAALAPLWRDLQQRADITVFLTWAWIGAWIAETAIPPVVLVGRAEGQVVLLGVLVPTSRRDALPIPIHGLQLHTTGVAAEDVITLEYNGFLTDRRFPEASAAAWRFLLGGITVAGHRRDEAHLRNAVAAPGATPFPPSAIPRGVTVRELFRKPSWRVDLDALRAAGTSYLDSLSANTRQQIRRAMRQYERRGPLTATRARDAAEGLAFLDELKILHQRYWTGRGHPGGFAYPFFERFQRRLIETGLSEGALELVRIACGPDTVGYVYNVTHAGQIMAYQTGIDYTEARLKPGLVSHALCIQMHLDEGASVYDFMAGAARYKASLGTPGPELVYCVAERPTLALRLEQALRGVRRKLRKAK